MARPQNSTVRPIGSLVIYCALLACAFLIGLRISMSGLGRQIDDNVYDFFFRAYQPKPWRLSSIILAIDEPTLHQFNGIRGVRTALATGLNLIREAHPSAVAVDIILAESSEDDAALEAAFAATPNLVLDCELAGGWEDPIPRFKRHAAALGQVYVEPGDDAVSRIIELYKITGQGGSSDRRWAIALAAYNVSHGIDRPVESPNDLQVGGVVIPATRDSGYRMRIRYVPASLQSIPRISVAELVKDPSRAREFAGKVVFAGVTAQTAERDRWITPLSHSVPMAGVEMNANAYETIANRLFLVDAPAEWPVLAAFAAVVTAGLIWYFAGGVAATGLSFALLAAAHLIPYALFTRGTVVPYTQAVIPAWLALITGASWQYLYVRRRLGHSEAEKGRYQQAMQFVTHEMRTPLTAIQGSSELIHRYPGMPEEKRRQINDLIVSESKRLGHMIEVFLNVERLSAGQMELKSELFNLASLIERCCSRARPLADGKQISIEVQPLPTEDLRGDRELMEYAFYNLLTNAIKYSPVETRVRIFGMQEDGVVRVSVEDQGIGMDQKEVRRIFEKFYRTRRAEQSGEVGTGIGLSIVEQIVTQHGGSIDVLSTPGKGSCFTLVLPSVNTHA